MRSVDAAGVEVEVPALAQATSMRCVNAMADLAPGEQVVLGASDKYIGLCRKHWMVGDPGPGLRAEDLENGAVPGVCAGRQEAEDE